MINDRMKWDALKSDPEALKKLAEELSLKI
jgi:hypothetical protein